MGMCLSVERGCSVWKSVRRGVGTGWADMGRYMERGVCRERSIMVWGVSVCSHTEEMGLSNE